MSIFANRSSERIHHSFPCQMKGDKWGGKQARLINLSVDGMLVTCEKDVQLKKEDKLTVSFPFTQLDTSALLQHDLFVEADEENHADHIDNRDLIFQTKLKRIEEKDETLYLGLQICDDADPKDLELLEECWLTLNFESRD